MASLHRSLLVQLPLNPSAPMESTGNVPFAGAALAAAAGLPPDSVLDQDLADTLGDRALASEISSRKPDLVGFSLYMWNVERSAYLARRLKERLPGLLTVAGGPEVHRDNRWLIESGDFDLLVSGEGEMMASAFLDPASLEKLIAGPGSYLETGSMTFPPGRYPNPWLSGHLDPGTAGSVMVETVRGCSGGCSYCSYRRTHPEPRIMNAEESAAMLRDLEAAGASEFVFLDPTFNTRPDLVQLLGNMETLEACSFAEIRGELVTPPIARLMAAAGFRSVEIGLQSSNRATLAGIGRDSDPLEILDGAMHLKRAGVTPVIDMILGLPGDMPEDSIRAATMIRDRGLHSHVQVFYLSVLPGTPLWNRISGHMSRPPYCFCRTPDMGGFLDAREEVADILGYDLNMPRRPLVFNGWKGTEEMNIDEGIPAARNMPSCRHGVLRLLSSDPWEHRRIILDAVRSRVDADPFCVLDIILIPGSEFPLDVIDLMKTIRGEPDYSGRTADILGLQGNQRVSVLLSEPGKFSSGWIESAAECTTVIADVNGPGDIEPGLLAAGVHPRLTGRSWDIPELASEVPSLHQVLFREESMERAWSKAMDL